MMHIPSSIIQTGSPREIQIWSPILLLSLVLDPSSRTQGFQNLFDAWNAVQLQFRNLLKFCSHYNLFLLWFVPKISCSGFAWQQKLLGIRSAGDLFDIWIRTKLKSDPATSLIEVLRQQWLGLPRRRRTKHVWMTMLEEEKDTVWIWYSFQTPTTKKIKSVARNGIFMWKEKLEDMRVSVGPTAHQCDTINDLSLIRWPKIILALN